MVEFVSLLLGLLAGPTRVEVAVDPAVAVVVFELDGERAGELSGPPWELTIDLGGLAARRLEARAVDARGRELGRATRLLNVYRPPAAIGYVLHRNSSGWVTMMSLSWEGRGRAEPRRAAVAVDGRAVELEDPSRIWLPPLDPEEFHVIETVVEYGDGVVARDQIGVGGPALGDTSARVSAVPAAVASEAKTAVAEATTAKLAGSGEPVRVLGVERGDSEIVFVRDAWAARAIERIGPARPSMGALGGGRDAQAARVIHSVPLRDGERVRILEPTGSGDSALDLHRTPVPLVSGQVGGFGLFWHLKNLDGEESEAGSAPISDAVAVAAGRAAFSSRRRAVVLVLAPESADVGSRLSPQAVRGYLDSLGVPLHVWYVGKPAKAPALWGEPTAVRSVAGMEQALDGVRAALERQRIVWVDGVHLPDEIEARVGSPPAVTPGVSGPP